MVARKAIRFLPFLITFLKANKIKRKRIWKRLLKVRALINKLSTSGKKRVRQIRKVRIQPPQTKLISPQQSKRAKMENLLSLPMKR